MWISRTRGTRERRREGPLAQSRPRPPRGSTWTTTSAPGTRLLDRRLDRVGRRVALPDRGAGRDADHDVGEMATGRAPHAQAAELDGRPERLDRATRRLDLVRRRPVHEHVDVLTDQPPGGGEHEHRDEQRRDASPSA